MSALGSLLAGVAHELNNPLAIVVGHAMMLSEEAKDPDVLRQIKKIVDAAERCSKIVRTFLTMARQDPVRMELANISELVETVVEVARHGNPEQRVKIELVSDNALPKVNLDHDRISKAIVNLIINAEQAIEESGIGDFVRVITRQDASKKMLQLVVEDNGPGISPDIHGPGF